MLRSEIIILENAVGAILNKQGAVRDSQREDYLAGELSHVQTLCVDLKKKWTHELLSSAKEPVIKRYIQYHQAGIILLSDKVSSQLPALLNSPSLSRNNLLADILTELEGVLDFLRQHFYNYFDLDHKVSIYYCRILKSKIADFEPQLKSLDDLKVNQNLLDIVVRGTEEVITECTIAGVSYRQAEQALHVVSMLHQLMLYGTNITTASLIDSLYRQNFNSLHFLDWYKDYQLAEIAGIPDTNEKDKLIHAYIKKFTAIYVNPDKAIQPELPSTNLYFISLLEGLHCAGVKQMTNKDSFQFPLNLSVPQFALFIRIFYKTGCFPIENVALITRFFTEHFTTKKQPHISHKSFGRAFYNLDQSAAAVVRDYLQKMINYLNKTYFP